MPKDVFAGQVLCFSGKLSLAQKHFEERIRAHGGEVASSVTAAVTHLVSTKDELIAGTSKVMAARGRDLPIVSESFIWHSLTFEQLQDPNNYVLGKKRKAAKKAAAKAPPAKVPRKTKIVEPRLKLEKLVETTDDIPVIAKSGLAGVARVVTEEIKKGFVTAELTWDVELVLHDAATGTDKYYNMQLVSAIACFEYSVIQHHGRTGMPGSVRVDGPWKTVNDAKKLFRTRFKQKTGLVWGALAGSFEEDMPGKYKLLARGARKAAKKEEEDGPGKWQYFLHNKVDGKKIAWYDYEDKAGEDMEKYWATHMSNAGRGLEVRFVRSAYWRYEINFTDMVQTNVKTGMRRVIRRLAPGDLGSKEPPEKIPEPAEPKAEEEEEEDDEDEEDEDEEDEGDEDVEEDGDAGEDDEDDTDLADEVAPEEEEVKEKEPKRAPLPPGKEAAAKRAPPPRK